jgi:hypothetical protein
MNNVTTVNNAITTSEMIANLAADESNIVSMLNSVFFKKGLTPAKAFMLSAACVQVAQDVESLDAEDLHDGIEALMHMGYIEIAGVKYKGTDLMDRAEWLPVLLSSEAFLVIGDEVHLGKMLSKLATEVKTTYTPMPKAELKRRFKPKFKFSPLTEKAITHLETLESTVDTYMLDIAKKVSTKMELEDDIKEAEGYVLSGCDVLVANGNLPTVSEFKPDTRGRLYHASCHGYNGQAGDRSRALQELHGVSIGYEVEPARQAILDEMLDMVKVKGDSRDEKISEVRKLYSEFKKDPEAAVYKYEMKKRLGIKTVSKPYSFLKASRILEKLRGYELGRNEKPYIGMVFGLDAKCSGPQMAALIVGQQDVAAACGFQMNMKGNVDAYELAQVELTKAGFEAFSRAEIKAAYMPVFYGQAAGAFVKVEAFGDLDTPEKEAIALAIFKKVHGTTDESEACEDMAKKFHGAVEASFGPKTQKLRRHMRALAGAFDRTEELSTGDVVYQRVDGQAVGMAYRKKVNAHGHMLQSHNDEKPDMFCFLGDSSLKLKAPTFATHEVDHGDHARNHFVNFIQGTDALMAALITAHAADMDCPIVAVHDCFRTDINNFLAGNLNLAILKAYKELFGGVEQQFTDHLPLGQDMLKGFYAGVIKARKPEHKMLAHPTMFYPNGKRKSRKVNGISYDALINQFSGGKTGTYFFAK